MDDNRGMRLSDALSSVAPSKADTPSEWGEMGRGLMQSVMEGMQKQMQELAQGKTASATAPSVLQQLTEYAMTQKVMKQAFEEEKPSAAGEDKGMWMFMAETMKSQSAMMQALLQTMVKTDNPQTTFIQAVEAVKALMPGADPRSQAFDQLANQALVDKLTSNPLEGYLAMRESIKQELQGESDHTNVIDLDVWKAKEEYKLEREKIAAAKEEREAQAKNTQQLLGGLAEMARPQPGGNPTPAPGPNGPVGTPENLVRYTCHACQTQFVTQRTASGTCPHCQAGFIDPEAGPEAPATDAPLLDGTPPAPAAPGVDDIVTGSDLWSEISY